VKWGQLWTRPRPERASTASAQRRVAPPPASAAHFPDAIRAALLATAGSPRGLVSYDEAVAAVCDATGWPVGHAWLLGPTGWRSSGAWHASVDEGASKALRETTAMTDLGSGRGIVAAVLHLQSCRFLPGLEGLASPLRQAQAAALGLRGVVGVPVHSGAGSSRRVSGVLEFITVGEVEPDGGLAEALLEVAAHTRRRVAQRRRPLAAPTQSGEAVAPELRDDLAG
jgi:hypothetical protein